MLCISVVADRLGLVDMSSYICAVGGWWCKLCVDMSSCSKVKALVPEASNKLGE